MQLADFPIGERAEIADPPNHVLGLAHLNQAPAHVNVGPSHGVLDLLQGNVVCQELDGIDDDLILLDESAERRNFTDAGHGRELVAQIPILQTAKIREILLTCQKRPSIQRARLIPPHQYDRFQPISNLQRRLVK